MFFIQFFQILSHKVKPRNSHSELKDWNDLIPVDLLQPLVYTCSMKFMMTRQYPQAVSFLIFHKAYITSTRSPKAEDDVR
jgi:hypothetical protein